MSKFRFAVALLLVAFLSFALVGCNSSSGGGGGLAGGIGKAALNNATVTIQDANGAAVGTGTVTNGRVTYSLTGAPVYPIFLTATGGELLTGSTTKPFAGTLRAVALSGQSVINMTSFTTLHAEMYEATNPNLTPAERYTEAENAMNGLFDILGVDVGATVDFLRDDPYAGANSEAYEMGQQVLAYACNQSDAAGLADIGTKLADLADDYVADVAAGNDPVATVVATVDANLGGGTGIADGPTLAAYFQNADVKAEIAAATIEAVEGAGATPSTQAEIEAAITTPASYNTTVVAIVSGTALGGTKAATLPATATINNLDLQLADGTTPGGNVTVSWSSAYSVDADFVQFPAATNITNGGTIALDGATDLVIDYPDTAGVYSITLTSVANPQVSVTIVIEGLAAGSQSVTGVELRNNGSASSSAGMSFVGDAGATDGGKPSILGDASATAADFDDLSAYVTIAGGAVSPQDYVVNFIAPSGIRFKKGSANYPNYGIVWSANASGLASLNDEGLLVLGNPTAGLKTFKVNVETLAGTVLASDTLNIYTINDDFKSYVAKVTGFTYAGSKTGSADTPYDLNSANWSGTIQTWNSLAGLGASGSSSIATHYDAPILSLAPGTSVAGYGLSDDGTAYDNYLTPTGAGWAMTGGSGATTFGGAGAARVAKVPSAAGSTNQLKVWLVIPAATGNSGADIVSDVPVIFTR